MWGCMWGKRCTTHNNTTTPLRAITDLDVMEQAFASGQDEFFNRLFHVVHAMLRYKWEMWLYDITN